MHHIEQGKRHSIGIYQRVEKMLIEADKLNEQVQEPCDATVKEVYLALAHATLPEGLTVRPTGHGYISRELRFETDGKWHYSAVLNKNWVLWYFRRPALKARKTDTGEIQMHFPDAEVTGQGEVKLRIHNMNSALAVLGWIHQNCSTVDKTIQ